MSVAVRIAYPLRLARARVAHRPARLLLVATGIAAGACVLALVYAGSLVIRDRALERAAAALPASERSVQATWFGTLSTGAGNWCGARTNFTDVAAWPDGAEPVGIADVGGTPDALGDSDCCDMFEVQAARASATTGIHHRYRMPARAAIERAA